MRGTAAAVTAIREEEDTKLGVLFTGKEANLNIKTESQSKSLATYYSPLLLIIRKTFQYTDVYGNNLFLKLLKFYILFY